MLLKKLGLILGSVMLTALSSLALAAPMLNFDIDSDNSSVDSSGLSLCSDCTANFTLDGGLGNQIFSLAEGDSYTFDFFGVEANGPSSGLGTVGGFVTAIMAFESPDASPAQGTGIGGAAWAWFFGFGGAGGLTFELAGQPGTITAADSSMFDVSFSTVGDTCSGIGCTLNQTVSATITALKVAEVSEPGTLALLGIALSVLVASRKKFSA